MAQIEARGAAFRARVRRMGAPDISRTFTDRDDAAAWAARIEGALANGTLDAGAERNRIRALQRSRLGSLALAHLTRRELRAYRDAKSGTGVNRDLALVSNVLKWGRAERDLPVDPAIMKGLKRPENGARTRRLRPGEEAALMAAAPSIAPWLAPAITLLVETGMRRGELFGLTWADVDLKRRVATLRATKNGDANVPVPLSTRAASALEALPRGIGQARVLPIGCVDALGDGFRDACKRAGIEGLRLHDLRAEAVSRLFERGLSLPEVRAISRHKSSALLRYVRSGDVEALARRLG